MNSLVSKITCIHLLFAQNKHMHVKRIKPLRHCLRKWRGGKEKEEGSCFLFIITFPFSASSPPYFLNALLPTRRVTTFARGFTTNCHTDCHTLPTKNFISHIINLGNYAADKYNSVVAAASGPGCNESRCYNVPHYCPGRKLEVSYPSGVPPVPARRAMKHNGWSSISSRCNALRSNCRIPYQNRATALTTIIQIV